MSRLAVLQLTYRLGQHLAQAGKAGQSLYRLHAGLALNEGKGIVDEGALDAVAGSVDPLAGNLALEVGNALQRQKLGVAHILAVQVVALEGHHLVGVAVYGCLHSGLAGEVGFHSVRGGGQVSGAALQQGRLDGTHLGGGNAFAHHLSQLVGQATQLGVAETVVAIGLGFGDELAVFVVDTFGHYHQALAGSVVALLYIVEEAFHVEVNLGQVDKVGAGAGVVGQSCSGGKPTSVAAHHFDDGHHTGVVARSIVLHFHAGGSDVLGSGSKAGAVIGAVQVVVDGLGNAHYAAFVTTLLHELGNLVAGIHGVVTTVVEEVTHIELLEGFKNFLVVGGVHIGVLHLVAASTQSGGGGELEEFELCRVFHAHVIKLFVEHAGDAVGSAEYASNLGGVESRLHSAENAGVNHSGRTAGLADDACTFKFFHISDTVVWLA